MEGTRLQLKSSSGKTDAVVVSTLMEAWKVLQSGLVADGSVMDVRPCATLNLRLAQCVTADSLRVASSRE